MSGCLTDETMVLFVEGSLTAEEVERVQHHIDGCSDCFRLVAAASLRMEADLGPPPSGTSGADPGPLGASEEDGLRVGERLGNYCVVRKLGEGAMGLVYEAVHEKINRRVAIKLLKLHYSQKREFTQRF